MYAQMTAACPGAQPISVSAAAAAGMAPRIVATGPARRIAASPRKLPPPAVSATAIINVVVRSGASPRRSVTAGTVVYTAATETPCAANAIVTTFRAPTLETGCPKPARGDASKDMMLLFL
jgi:hypothetical protein